MKCMNPSAFFNHLVQILHVSLVYVKFWKKNAIYQINSHKDLQPSSLGVVAALIRTPMQGVWASSLTQWRRLRVARVG